METTSSGATQEFNNNFFSSGKIYLITAPVDFRKGMSSLTTVAKGAGLDLLGNDEIWVVFVSKVLKAVKIIHADSTGVVLLNRHLHQGRFQRQKSPCEGKAIKEITSTQLLEYLKGRDIECNRNFILTRG